MDVSSPALAPRVLPDLRPVADAAATARLVRPEAALAVPPVPAPSPTQAGLVSRSVLESDRDLRRPGEEPPRVLKPWGVSMLPAEGRQPQARPPCRDGAEREGPGGRVPDQG